MVMAQRTAKVSNFDFRVEFLMCLSFQVCWSVTWYCSLISEQSLSRFVLDSAEYAELRITVTVKVHSDSYRTASGSDRILHPAAAIIFSSRRLIGSGCYRSRFCNEGS